MEIHLLNMFCKIRHTKLKRVTHVQGDPKYLILFGMPISVIISNHFREEKYYRVIFLYSTPVPRIDKVRTPRLTISETSRLAQLLLHGILQKAW